MNRHSAAGNDEANSQSHHELQEEIAQFVDRERVLIGENDQLRAQLVDMKEKEKKKYDDLMVQYNMKREYEDDGLDKQGTSNNQVTVKTEWDDEEVKVEIKEEDEDDEDSGWDRCVVKKEEVEDGEETRIIDMETLTEDRQVKREIEQEENEMTLHNDQIGHWVKREFKEEEEDGEMMMDIKEEEEEVNETTNKEEMLQVKEEIKEEDEEEEECEAQIDDIEGWAESNQSGDDACQALDNVPLNTTLTHPTGQSQLTVTQSADLLSPQTSTAQDETSPTALDQQTTVPTRHNKRKQQTSKRSAKRSKITIEEDGEDFEDIVNEDREESKVKVLNLNCTQSNCNVKLDSMVQLHDHLSTVHQLSPLQCFATNCNARFDSPRQILDHIQQNHSRNTRFICPVCPKEHDSQHKAYNHWYKNHLTGQFQCNLVSDCAQVTDTRSKMSTHQKIKHRSQSKHFHCSHPGCTASFFSNSRLKQHQLTHLATNQFHCNWPHCSKQCKLRSNLVMHIRMQHFGLPKSMKAQKEKNIVDLREPNEYVRVVVDE